MEGWGGVRRLGKPAGRGFFMPQSQTQHKAVSLKRNGYKQAVTVLFSVTIEPLRLEQAVTYGHFQKCRKNRKIINGVFSVQGPVSYACRGLQKFLRASNSLANLLAVQPIASTHLKTRKSPKWLDWG